jgi:hypothetical protein
VLLTDSAPFKRISDKHEHKKKPITPKTPITPKKPITPKTPITLKRHPKKHP